MTFLLFLGLGLLALPAARVPSAGTGTGTGAGPAAGRASARPGVPSRTLQLGGAFGVAVVAVLLAGPTTGGLVAVVAAPAAWAAVARLHDRTARTRSDPALPLALDLAAAVLRAGQPVASALHLVAPVLDAPAGAALVRTARLLELGADPDDAWGTANSAAALAGVAPLARRSATSGIRLASALDRAAAQLRVAAVARGQARAHRAGALAVAPLGLCFLPAFVCLGIVPVVAGIAHSVLSAV